jgi:hypothetical protein
MELVKSIVGKVVGGAVALAVVAAGISWWRLDEAMRHELVSGAGKIVGWAVVVGVVPWVTFFVVGWVEKRDSNLAGAMLVIAYTAAEMLLLMWLFGWKVTGASAWTFVGVGALLAAAYNLFACDWIAEKI